MSTQIQVLPKSGITIGTTPITSGVAGRILFEGAGNVAQEDSAFFWDNTNKRLGIGTSAPVSSLDLNGSMRLTGSIDSQGLGYFAGSIWSNIYRNLWGAEVFRITLGTNNVGIGTTSPAARLDVKAQGALSTDIAFRVRNSADTQNLHELRGDGSWFKRNNAGSAFLYYDGASTYEFATPSQLFLQTNTSTSAFSILHNGTGAGTYLALRTQTQALFIYRNGNFYFGASPQAGNGTNSLILENGTAPTVNQADRAYLYSADITAGNAAPHFRTEDGSVIKLYQNAAVTTSQGIADALTNLGMLANSTIVDGATNRQTASYTLALTDVSKLIEMNVVTANNLTVPISTSINFPIGTKIDVVQYGVGQTTFVETVGVTIRSANNWLKINARYGAATLTKIGTDEWYLWGNLNA